MTTPLTDEEIKRLRELCEKATPGPWESTGYDDHPGDQGWYVNALQPGGAVAVALPYNRRAEADHLLIIAARTALPRLLDEVDRLKEANIFDQSAEDRNLDRIGKEERSQPPD